MLEIATQENWQNFIWSVRNHTESMQGLFRIRLHQNATFEN